MRADQDHEAFWVLHDRYFEQQGAIVNATLLDQSREWLQQSASIDMDLWESCAMDEESAANQSAVLRVEVSVATAERIGGDRYACILRERTFSKWYSAA